MTDRKDPAEFLDITGPEGITLFWHAKAWLLVEFEGELQEILDETWQHYKEISDERLLALVGALCVEEAVQSILEAMSKGFKELEGDADFTYSMKIKVARALNLLPRRILTACDLVRQIRNAFAHDLKLKSFSHLDARKHLSKLEPTVRSFNTATRDPTDYAKLFRELVGFILTALHVYSHHISALREWLMTPNAREPFAEWAKARSSRAGDA